MPAVPVWPFGSFASRARLSRRGCGGTGRRAGCGVACDAAWRRCRLCRCGRLVRSLRGLGFPDAGVAVLVDAPAAASLAIPPGGDAGCAGVAVWFVRFEG